MKIKYLIFLILILFFPDGNFGQIYDYFGRNKVQYTKFGWKILTTDHFNIYFYPEMKDVAERGAYYAEEAFSKHENLFNHTIDKKIPLIFYSSHHHFQQTNVIPINLPTGVQGFMEYMKGRVVIPNQGSMSKFKRVINHEMVHVFMHSKFNSINRAHKQYSRSGVPLWFSEGLAELWSGDWDMQSEMVIRDAVLSGYLVPINDIYTISGSYLMYKEGENFLRFLSDKYGKEKILLLMENYWRAKRFPIVFRLTYGGKSLKELNDEWIYYLKKKYYPIIDNEDIPSMSAVKITDLGNNSKPVYYNSDDGEKVLFISNRTGYTNIYMKDLHLSDEEKKPEIIIEGERTPEFESFQIFQSRIDISDSGILTFVTKSGERDLLYLYDINKRELLDSYKFEELVSLSSPCWSPDETKIVFTGLSEAGNRDLYIIDIKTGKLTELTNDIFDDKNPSWSNNGKYIAFSSDRNTFGDDGYYNLFLYDLNNNNIYYLTYGEHNDYSPSWSPDDKYIAFTSDREKSTNIWLLNSDFIVKLNRNKAELDETYLVKSNNIHNSNDSNIKVPSRKLKKVTNMVTATFDPSWIKDGGLLFTSFENFGFQVQMIKDFEELLSDEENHPTEELEHVEWIPGKILGTGKNTRLYKKNYTLDFAAGQVSMNNPFWGNMGGASFAISDMLGNDHYNVLIYNNAYSGEDFFNSFNFALTRLSLAKRTNFYYGLYHFDYRFYRRFINYYDEEIYGGFFTVRYPLSQFKRFEANVTLASSDRINYETLYRRKAFLISNYFSFVKDNSLWGPTGPLDGERYSVTLGYTSDIVYSNVGYWSLNWDYRKYIRLSYRTALAVRTMFLMNYGRETQRFYMGGSWDLRGYRRFSLWGDRLGLVSTELRYPFIDSLFIRFPFGGLRFNSIRGALFIDAGNAWENNFDSLLGSVGTGVRLSLGFLVLRFDVGKRIENNFKSLQKGFFTQFFFGYDF